MKKFYNNYKEFIHLYIASSIFNTLIRTVPIGGSTFYEIFNLEERVFAYFVSFVIAYLAAFYINRRYEKYLLKKKIEKTLLKILKSRGVDTEKLKLRNIKKQKDKPKEKEPKE